MTRQLPIPVHRVLVRFVHRDAAAMLAERISDRALVGVSRWMRSYVWGKVNGLRGRAPMLMQILDETAAAARAAQAWHESFAIFGAGLVIGCQLRDLVEQDTPVTCLVDFDLATKHLDTTESLNALWDCGLPGHPSTLGELVSDLLELAPPLRFKMMLTDQLVHGMPRRRKKLLYHLHFIVGLIAAGVSPPSLCCDEG
ncbi:MAG: hypothetical protein HZB39_08440 [Planctomycetes bacterium]|nr:hypothetical protein [Planctomycetota bacterium]